MKTIQIELNDFLAAIIGIAAGLLLLVFPQEAINVITYGIGIVSLVYGIVRIVDYFKNRDISPFFAGELILGVVLVGIGLFSFLNPGGIFAILPIIFGILVLVEGISKLQRALMLRRYGYPRWVAALVLAIAIMVLGVVLVLNPFGALVMTVRVLGAVILVDGLTGLWVSLILKNEFLKEPLTISCPSRGGLLCCGRAGYFFLSKNLMRRNPNGKLYPCARPGDDQLPGDFI